MSDLLERIEGAEKGSRDTVIGPWRIWFERKPVPGCDWSYLHEDYDGPESPAWMSGHLATRDDCLEAIIIQYEERGS